MLNVEQSLNLLESLLDLSLPVQILSVVYLLVVVWSIAQVIFFSFERHALLGFVMLVLSPLSIVFYLIMGLFYSALEVKELLAFMVTNQNPLTISLALSLGTWFVIAWSKAHLFWEPLTRILCLSVLYFIVLALLRQFPLFS